MKFLPVRIADIAVVPLPMNGSSTMSLGLLECFIMFVIKSIGFGVDQNLISGQTLQLSNLVIGVDNTVYVSLAGVQGGADIESDVELRDRMLFRYSNIFGSGIGENPGAACPIKGVPR